MTAVDRAACLPPILDLGVDDWGGVLAGIEYALSPDAVFVAPRAEVLRDMADLLDARATAEDLRDALVAGEDGTGAYMRALALANDHVLAKLAELAAARST